MSVSGAASGGNYRAALEALRDRLAAEVDDADGRTLAPLAKQLADVLARIEEMPVAREASPLDDIADQLAARRKAAS